MGQKKKFFDKKSAVKFKVVHRSQYDPLIADENAPKYVLVPVAGDVARADEFVNYDVGEGYESGEEAGKDSKYSRLEKQAQYGVYYDDDYDYMQHLREVGATDAVVIEAAPPKRSVRFNLPKEVLPSAVENDYAPLDLQAQQGNGLTMELLATDLEVMAQLDDDAQHCDDWAIDDDFIAQAQDGEGKGSDYEHEAGDGEFEEGEEGEYFDTDDEERGPASDRGVVSDGDADFAAEETRSRFTEYSMTSSAMHRNDKLQLLDERFERMYADYDEENIGELSEEEAGAGGRDIAEFEDVLDDYILSRENIDYDPDNKPATGIKDCPAVRSVVEGAVEEDMTEEEKTAWRERMERRDEWLSEIYESRAKADNDEPKWDCETILSTYSNIYNHPKLISEGKGKKPRKPILEEAEQEEGDKADAANVSDAEAASDAEDSGSEDEGDRDAGNAGAKREKSESKEEKKARKQAVKAARKERREEKKSNKLAFKAEKLRQEKISNTKAVRL